MIESTFAALAALFLALLAWPAAVLVILLGAGLFYGGHRWSVRKAKNHPEWFARLAAKDAAIDANAAEVWRRIVAGFDRAKG